MTLGPPQFVTFTEKGGLPSLRWMRPVLDEHGRWLSWVMP